jgi:cyclophilin family peptidyl-prolyl cis-trans isomerase
MHRTAFLEPLEARIAPALLVVNPLADIVAGAGKTGATIELSQMFDPLVANPGHTLVSFRLNLDMDANTPGIQLDTDPATPGVQPPVIVLELFDDEAPLTVQNFLRYATNPNTAQDFVNTFFHRSVPGFVVQGGGFAVDGPTIQTHIPVGLEVHNEFSPTRSNLRGTIAMAKTGLSPNTATSEWFVNLADNSANLDNQNGGFTVFGRVIQGMDLMDKIATLPRSNLGGALTDTPLQNYNSDPDNNPLTPPPAPKPANLITIKSTTVTPPVPGNATGLSFSVVSVTDASTGQPSDVLTATVAGTKLNLKYAPGKSGVVNVTVRTSAAGETPVDETFQVTVRPNLVGNVTSDALPPILVPGDVGVAKIRVGNNGAAAYAGNVDVKFYLSKIGGADPNGTLLDPTVDKLVGSLLGQPVNLVGNGRALLAVNITIPEELADVNREAYRLIASITPGSATTELFTDDNVAVDGGAHVLVNEFGNLAVSNFGTRDGARLTYVEADGTRVSIGVTAGGGTGLLTKSGGLVNVEITGTSALSTVGVKANGRVAWNNIEIANPIGAANFGKVDPTGHVTLSGGVQTLRLGDMAGDKTLILGAFPTSGTRASIFLGRVTDLSVESDQPIALLQAVEWRDTTGNRDTILTPVLGALNITGRRDAVTGAVLVRGDFEADVFVEGRALINAITVAGLMKDSTIQTSGSITAVTLGGMDSSAVFSAVAERPSALSDFARQTSIGKFTITGGLGAGVPLFVDSQVAARTLGEVLVRGVNGASGTGDFGFVADTIASYTRVGTDKVGVALSAPTTFDRLNNYAVVIL